MFIWWDYNILCGYNEIYDWLVVYLPLWKIWVRQLGSWNSQYGKMFQPCSKPPTRWYMDMEHGEPNWCFFPGGGRKYRPPNSVKKSRAHLVDLILFRIFSLQFRKVAQVWTNNVGGSSTKWFLRWVIYIDIPQKGPGRLSWTETNDVHRPGPGPSPSTGINWMVSNGQMSNHATELLWELVVQHVTTKKYIYIYNGDKTVKPRKTSWQKS